MIYAASSIGIQAPSMTLNIMQTSVLVFLAIWALCVIAKDEIKSVNLMAFLLILLASSFGVGIVSAIILIWER